MEHLLQDIIALGMLAVIGVPFLSLVRDLWCRMVAEQSAMQRGFELAAAGVEMSDFPDSLAGYRMFLGNQLYFNKIHPAQCAPFIGEAKRLAARSNGLVV